MDAKDMQSDLLALKRLYGLLKTDGDDTSISATDSLDEHARSLLKNLLDAATERVLKEHAELIADQVVVASGTISATPPSKLPITAAEVSQGREKEMEPDKDRKADGLDITFWKEKRLRPHWSQPSGVEPLMPNALATGLGLRNNRCRLCRRNTINHMEPLEETHFYERPEDIDCLSKEAYIESCMSALRIIADPLHQVPIEAEEMNQPYWLLNQTRCLAQPNEPIMSGGPALGNWIMSRYDFQPSRARNIQNLSAQLDPSETSYRAPIWPITFSSASKMEDPTQSRVAVEEECSRVRPFHFMIPNNSEIIDSGLNVSSISGPHGKIHKKPSEPLDFQGNQSDAQHNHGIRKNRQYINSTMTQQESDGGTTSDSYSEWTSEKTSCGGSDSEEYSLTGQTGEDMTSSSSWSGSEASSPSSYGRRGHKIEDDDDDASSSTSHVESHESIFSASFKSKGYSSGSKKPGPSRIRKANEKIRKKQNGIWKRMKDKMEIIFHHHHHHHYHHHNGDSKPKMSCTVSLLEHKGKAVNFNRQDEEVYEEKAVQKVKKSMIRGKDQKSHFCGMMEGLLRHVRHSKQSKEVSDKLGKGRHEKQRALNKSHWSKVLQHHRGRKLPNKSHMKLGLGKRKVGLKALPNMK